MRAGRKTRRKGEQCIAFTNKAAKRAAKKLGFGKEVKDPPFSSHGNKVFSNGQYLITADRDGHSGGAWKMFDLFGRRLGTYDENLKRIGA
jgi:hypothetical protein